MSFIKSILLLHVTFIAIRGAIIQEFFDIQHSACTDLQETMVFYPDDGEQYPLLSFAHSRGNPENYYQVLFHALAESGYVVVVPLGCQDDDWAPENLAAEQMNVVVEIMENSAFLDIKQRVNVTRPVGIIGHAIGSFSTALNAADPELVYDFRIGAMVALNPFYMDGVNVNSQVPSLWITGETDDISPPKYGYDLFQSCTLDSSTFLQGNNMGHNECMKDTCLYGPKVVQFFNCHLKDDKSACAMCPWMMDEDEFSMCEQKTICSAEKWDEIGQVFQARSADCASALETGHMCTCLQTFNVTEAQALFLHPVDCFLTGEEKTMMEWWHYCQTHDDPGYIQIAEHQGCAIISTKNAIGAGMEFSSVDACSTYLTTHESSCPGGIFMFSSTPESAHTCYCCSSTGWTETNSWKMYQQTDYTEHMEYECFDEKRFSEVSILDTVVFHDITTANIDCQALCESNDKCQGISLHTIVGTTGLFERECYLHTYMTNMMTDHMNNCILDLPGEPSWILCKPSTDFQCDAHKKFTDFTSFERHVYTTDSAELECQTLCSLNDQCIGISMYTHTDAETTYYSCHLHTYVQNLFVATSTGDCEEPTADAGWSLCRNHAHPFYQPVFNAAQMYACTVDPAAVQAVLLTTTPPPAVTVVRLATTTDVHEQCEGLCTVDTSCTGFALHAVVGVDDMVYYDCYLTVYGLFPLDFPMDITDTLDHSDTPWFLCMHTERTGESTTTILPTFGWGTSMTEFDCAEGNKYTESAELDQIVLPKTDSVVVDCQQLCLNNDACVGVSIENDNMEFICYLYTIVMPGVFVEPVLTPSVVEVSTEYSTWFMCTHPIRTMELTGTDPYAADFTCTPAEKYSDFTHFDQHMLYDPVTFQSDCQELCVEHEQCTGISVHQVTDGDTILYYECYLSTYLQNVFTGSMDDCQESTDGDDSWARCEYSSHDIFTYAGHNFFDCVPSTKYSEFTHYQMQVYTTADLTSDEAVQHCQGLCVIDEQCVGVSIHEITSETDVQYECYLSTYLQNVLNGETDDCFEGADASWTLCKNVLREY